MYYGGCVCGGIIILSMVAGSYECIRCGEHCEHQPHIPHREASLDQVDSDYGFIRVSTPVTASGLKYPG